jgi:hypothetical protein
MVSCNEWEIGERDRKMWSYCSSGR